MTIGELSPDCQTLALTPSLRQGLTAITVLAGFSLFSSTVLFCYLGYKLVAWIFVARNRPDATESDQRPLQKSVDFALGIDGVFDNKKNLQPQSSGRIQHNAGQSVKNPPNQFIVLIFNLLLADMHQGLAFFLNFAWLKHGAISVETKTCFAQGLFVSTGDLASSTFITLIAIHTYLFVVKGKRVSQRVLYAAIAAAWVFVYAISVIPIAATNNGAMYGGFFVRAGSWCWINDSYEQLRLFTHYLYIFMALATTSALYTAIFVSLRRQARAEGLRAPSEREGSRLQLNHNPLFLIYPIIYVMCTLPLASGRIATMAGANVPLGYFCFAGALIASNGYFDCLLFGTTRNTIIFGSNYDLHSEDIGLNTFAFMQTPRGRRFGNMIWVQGGSRRSGNETSSGRWPWERSRRPDGRSDKNKSSRSDSVESLSGPTLAIQKDTVTSVVVELDDRDVAYTDPLESSSSSVNSTERDYPKELRRECR